MLNSHQVAEWQAYYQIEPWGQRPAWLRTGVIASVIANAFRGKRGKPLKPADFIPPEPKKHKRQRPQTVEEQRTVLQRIVAVAKKMRLTKE